MNEKTLANALPSLAIAKCVLGTAENSSVAGDSPTPSVFLEEKADNVITVETLPPRQFSTARLLVAHIGWVYFVHYHDIADPNIEHSAAMALFLATTDAVCSGLDIDMLYSPDTSFRR